AFTVVTIDVIARIPASCAFFFLNAAPPRDNDALSLHDALPISVAGLAVEQGELHVLDVVVRVRIEADRGPDVRGLDTHSNDYVRSEEHTSELQSQSNLVCRLLLEKKKRPTKDR